VPIQAILAIAVLATSMKAPATSSSRSRATSNARRR
jgi:hypothetical protein